MRCHNRESCLSSHGSSHLPPPHAVFFHRQHPHHAGSRSLQLLCKCPVSGLEVPPALGTPGFFPHRIRFSGTFSTCCRYFSHSRVEYLYIYPWMLSASLHLSPGKPASENMVLAAPFPQSVCKDLLPVLRLRCLPQSQYVLCRFRESRHVYIPIHTPPTHPSPQPDTDIPGACGNLEIQLCNLPYLHKYTPAFYDTAQPYTQIHRRGYKKDMAFFWYPPPIRTLLSEIPDCYNLVFYMWIRIILSEQALLSTSASVVFLPYEGFFP